MQKKSKLKLIMPVLLAGMILLFGTTPTSAQEAAPSASPAIPISKPSADEIARTLSRALDKLEKTQEASKAKDAVIEEQEKALEEERKAKELYKSASGINADAANIFKLKAETAEEAWKREEKYSRSLEKKLKSSNTKTKLAVIAGIAAAATLYLLK